MNILELSNLFLKLAGPKKISTPLDIAKIWGKYGGKIPKKVWETDFIGKPVFAYEVDFDGGNVGWSMKIGMNPEYKIYGAKLFIDSPTEIQKATWTSIADQAKEIWTDDDPEYWPSFDKGPINLNYADFRKDGFDKFFEVIVKPFLKN